MASCAISPQSGGYRQTAGHGFLFISMGYMWREGCIVNLETRVRATATVLRTCCDNPWEPHMIRTILLSGLGLVLVVLGLIGLLVPVLPGLLFLGAAVVCFSATSPRLQSRLDRHPAWRGFRRRWREGRGLPALRRLQLGFWITAEATLNTLRGRRR